jgi:tetratricopeptide (TPR) repeat protein
VERSEAAERQVRLAFGEDETVYAMSTNAVPRLDKLRAGLTNDLDHSGELSELSYYKRQALDEAARAALNLGRYGDAEAAARALLSLHPEREGLSECFYFTDQPDDVVWGQVLLAQAMAEQGRAAEALETLAPALAQYRDAQARGAAYVTFRQHFARALYAQALAEPADGAGAASARESLGQALALLQGLSDEARQLHDSQELLSWIAAAQKKLPPENSAEGRTSRP